MSLAAETRQAVRNRPVLFEALRAGVINYTAAADSLEVDGDREAIATALRRFAADLDEMPSPTEERSITVRLHSSLEQVDAEVLLAVEGSGITLAAPASEGSVSIEIDGQAALRASGDVDARLLAVVLERLRIAEIAVAAAGLAGETMVVVVDRRDGPRAVQLIEAVADSRY